MIARAQQDDGDRPAMDEAGPMQHRLTSEDKQAFLDARLAAVHAGLRLTPDQEKLWPAIESAIRDAVAQVREQRQKWKADSAGMDKKDPIARMRQIADRSAAVAQNLTKVADAAQPLYATLTDDQKWRLDALLHAIHMRHGPGPGRMGMMKGGGDEDWRSEEK
jgi:hypothetical protein